MPTINTVTGPIDSSQLGYTLVHEHLLLRSEAVAVQFPHLYDDDENYRKAIEQVTAVKSRGVKTICDPTVMGVGRDIRFLERVSRETGVQVVAATGVYSYNEIPQIFQNRDIDFLADTLVRDIEVGVQNTSIKAGFLKCTADAQGITPDLEKVFRAVARAQKRTGVPIMTHSHPATENGLKQLDIFEDEGVDPRFIMIGHCGDTDDVDYITRVLDRGVFIGMDRYGQAPLPYELRNVTLLELITKGYSERMFLSQDYCCSFDWFPPEHEFYKNYPKWSMTFLLDEVIPELRSKGVTDEQISTMMYDNVQRWFGGTYELPSSSVSQSASIS
ncbi:phosphotriesterase [Alicyclobacillus fastidiosus]|uniref:Phosphotriesterase n=1 Tax=Alicyclobacillus fastidiosus TaxID=392011 RepID=A0ABY6ZI50_9BACL|nr:phosphotriesterase [Alicyclobacillus fastidiosus]WAH41801.1 phosphotriesterase [Alicyclobacillus fastidiosus]GMA63498.1 phosphotriesterase [Alicyclobacillus fastidiosus]